MDFLQFLVENKKIKKKLREKIAKEVEKTAKSPEEIILNQKLLSEQELFQLKSKFLKIPLAKKLPKEFPPFLLKTISQKVLEHYKIVPLELDKEKRLLKVGMVFPEDLSAQQALRFLARQQNLKLQVYLINFSQFQKVLKQYQSPKKEMEEALSRLEKELAPQREVLKKPELKAMVQEAPIIKMVAVILREAVEGRASDIHIEPLRNNLRVRYRLDGVLHKSLVLPLAALPSIVARIKILSGLKIDETRRPQDGRFSMIIGGNSIDFRVSTFPTTMGEKVVIRVLNPQIGLKSLEDLGFLPFYLKTLKEAVEIPYGMILATGPTGCGKTTTLYTLLRILNKEGVNIVTLEDPVEYYLEGVNQSQVRPEIGYSFATGLRSILRQDPDIIMVGEIRDSETAELAIHAALTGHKVLSTLHTTKVINALPRLIDMGIQPYLIAPALTLIINQRLVRKLCPYCKKKVKAPKAIKHFILKTLENLPPNLKKRVSDRGSVFIYQAKGCEKCRQLGYSKRTGVFEMLKMTPSLEELILKKSSERELLTEMRRQNMITMLEDGILKVLEGITSFEEVMKITGGEV